MFFYIGKRINTIVMKFKNKFRQENKYKKDVDGVEKRRESKSNSTIIILTNLKTFPPPPLLVPHNFGVCVACTFWINSQEPEGSLKELHLPQSTTCKRRHHSENFSWDFPDSELIELEPKLRMRSLLKFMEGDQYFDIEPTHN